MNELAAQVAASISRDFDGDTADLNIDDVMALFPAYLDKVLKAQREVTLKVHMNPQAAARYFLDLIKESQA